MAALALIARARDAEPAPAPTAQRPAARPAATPAPPPAASPEEPAEPARKRQRPAPQTKPGPSLTLGLTEANPAFVWSAASGTELGPFAPWRDRVAGLRPRYLRILVDWPRLQPDPSSPPRFDLPADGCVRGVAPCRPFGGLRELLRAARSQQQGGGFEIVLTLLGVPDWAARAPSGCERPATGARSRPITAAGLQGYRALVRALVDLGRQEDVPLRWWSAWNEPNGPFFVSPQRPACDAGATSLSPAVYTRLFRALRSELRAAGGTRHLVLGDLADVVAPKPFVTGTREFLAALPRDVVCNADAVAQHDYAESGVDPTLPGAVGQVEEELGRRRCEGPEPPIWVTETGAGGAHAGDERERGDAVERADCVALNGWLRRWWRDPRVTVAFQYTYRDDPAFPVGLADPGLTRTWRTADLLDAWGGARKAGAPPPALPSRCRKGG